MQLVDVNVLVYAHREDAEDHRRYRAWLEAWLASDAASYVHGAVIEVSGGR